MASIQSTLVNNYDVILLNQFISKTEFFKDLNSTLQASLFRYNILRQTNDFCRLLNLVKLQFLSRSLPEE